MDEKRLPLSVRDKVVLERALQDDSGNPGARYVKLRAVPCVGAIWAFKILKCKHNAR